MQEESLEVLIKDAELLPLDSVALGNFFYQHLGILASEVKNLVEKFTHNEPLLTGIFDTCFGRVGLMTLPVPYKEICLDNNPISSIEKSMVSSESLGAKCIALNGLIPFNHEEHL